MDALLQAFAGAWLQADARHIAGLVQMVKAGETTITPIDKVPAALKQAIGIVHGKTTWCSAEPHCGRSMVTISQRGHRVAASDMGQINRMPQQP